MKRNEAIKGILTESRKFAMQLYTKYGKVLNMGDITELVYDGFVTYSNDLRIEEEMNRIEEENQSKGMETIFARSGNEDYYVMKKLADLQKGNEQE